MNLGKSDIPSNVSEWMAQVGDEELIASQKAALADWLRESPAHVREFLQMTSVQQDLKGLKISVEQLETWVKEAKSASREPISISTVLESTGRRATRPSETVVLRSRRSRIWLTAACLVATLFAGEFVRWEKGRYTTGFGEQRIVSLADGSVIEINTDSVLQVQFSANRRAIHLIKGEAFFRVAHDTSRPFVVSAGDADVKAVGTQFNVRIGSDSTLVSVIEGTVEVRDETPGAQGPGNELGVRITSGEEASITPVHLGNSEKQLAVAKIAASPSQRTASWRQGRVQFENMPLVDVLSEFQRYRDVRILIDDESIRQLKLTGSFDAHDVNSALAFIATLPGITVEEIDAHTFRVFRRSHP